MGRSRKSITKYVEVDVEVEIDSNDVLELIEEEWDEIMITPKEFKNVLQEASLEFRRHENLAMAVKIEDIIRRI